MDSHGRRVYGIDERTYERDMRNYFSEPSERVVHKGGNRKTVEVTVPRPGSGIDIVAIIKMLVIVGTLVAILKNVMEELNAQNQDNDDKDGDAFDKIFGSEFSGKFKDARLNEGVYHERRKEKILRDSKVDSNTTPPPEIRKLIPCPETPLLNFLRGVKPSKPPRADILELTRCSQAGPLFRILYRGYTYRELLSDKIAKWDWLSEASHYILESFKG